VSVPEGVHDEPVNFPPVHHLDKCIFHATMGHRSVLDPPVLTATGFRAGSNGMGCGSKMRIVKNGLRYL
jgi:hypothetical protein